MFLADGILRSFLFGMTLAAAVGPIALLIVNCGISRGFRAAFAAGCGAAVADLLSAMLAFIAGAQLLAWLADKQDGFRRLSSLLLTLVNPLTVLVFVGFAGQLPLGSSVRTAAALALAVFAGSLMVQTVLALGGAALTRVLSNSRWQRLLNGLSGAAIAAFGLHGMWQ